LKKYIRNNETISGRLHDEVVMMDINKGKYFAMNPVATHIWDLLEEPASIEELCAKLVQEYDIDEATCTKEVSHFIKEMTSLSLIKEM
jgi:hypothetical protein